MTWSRTHQMLERSKSPLSWSVATRRAFLLALPVAAPVWIMMLVASAALMLVLDAWETIENFWSAPEHKKLVVVFRNVGPASPTVFSSPPAPSPAPADGLSRSETVSAIRLVSSREDNTSASTSSETGEAMERVKTWNWADGAPLHKSA